MIALKMIQKSVLSDCVARVENKMNKKDKLKSWKSHLNRSIDFGLNNNWDINNMYRLLN